MSTVVDLDARAVAESVRVVRAAGDAGPEGLGLGLRLGLGLATPCADWDLGQLLEHMAGQHAGFAAAARGRDTGLAAWAPLPLGDDPVDAYRRAADDVLAAFAEPGVLERTMLLPEIHPRLRFPAATAIGFHLLDYVVHAWDVAAASGTAVDFGPEVLTAALAVAERVPAGAARTEPGAAFGPVLDLGGTVDMGGGTASSGGAGGDGTGSGGAAGVLDRVLALTGRSPGWRAPGASGR
jgi:uncharacterized protein (TIGR03086 family)